MVAGVTEPTTEPGDDLTPTLRSAMIARAWRSLLVRLVVLAVWAATVFVSLGVTPLVASLLGREQDTLEDIPFYVSVVVGVVVAGAAGLAVERRLGRRAPGAR